MIHPCTARRARDRAAARVRDAILNEAFFRLIGTSSRPPAALDFVGLNYYTRNVVRGEGLGLGALVGHACREPHHGADGPMSAIGWEVFPAGLRIGLERFSKYGLPIVITENGIATDDEALRSEYLMRHLAVLQDAIDAGLDVAGYFYWSLIDNFEWAMGTVPRFGLAAVDYETQERTPRPAAEVFERICRETRL